jgi:hypothetical protein
MILFKSLSSFFKKRKFTETKTIFHPSSSKLQRVSVKFLAFLFFLFILFFILSYWILDISFYIFNISSFIFFILIIILSLTLEPLPDKKDILIFEEDAINYEMRVVKENKNNKSFNRYIIPYSDIYKSYIHKNTLYIEYNINSNNVKIRREFSTHSQRLKISFSDYPDLKYFVLQPNISVKIKLRDFNNIKIAFFS